MISMTNMLTKLLQTMILVIILIFSTKFFQSTPFEKLFFQVHAGFLGIFAIFIFFYISNMFIKKITINNTVFYFLLLIFFMPLYSAFRAHAEFGQPYLYGILSQRGWLLIGVGIWFYYIISTKKITLSTIESSFLLLAWLSLLLFSIFALTFDPSQLTGDENFAHMTKDRGLRFKFQTFFISFGSMYYFIKYSVYKKPLDLLILFAFLAYIVFIIQGRTYMIFLAMVFLLYYYYNNPVGRFIAIIAKVMLLFLGILILIQTFMPEYVETMGNMFSQMFTVLTGEESTDSSANARIHESSVVFNYFSTHPLSIWFGVGRLSHQWNNGFETYFGYFYPSDIGLLGGMFLYGISGMVLLLLIPLGMEIKEIKKAKYTQNLFIETIKYMLILSIIKLVQGGLYLGTDIWIVIFFILFGYNRLNKGKNESI